MVTVMGIVMITGIVMVVVVINGDSDGGGDS